MMFSMSPSYTLLHITYYQVKHKVITNHLPYWLIIKNGGKWKKSCRHVRDKVNTIINSKKFWLNGKVLTH